jgi:hypothetical protein
MSRVPPTASGSGKNASGQEAFGSKKPETLVVESPAASAADVTSTTAGVGTTAAPEVDKAGTSAPPTTSGGGSDRGTSDPQPVPGPRGIINEGMELVNDEDRCLYAGTPWEAAVVTDHRDQETFKEAVRTIRTVLLVRTFTALLGFLLRVFGRCEV